MGDTVYTTTHVHLGILDRLRVLCGWKLDVRVTTRVEQDDARLVGDPTSEVRVWRRPLWRGRGGMAVSLGSPPTP